jgi:adenosine kinase
LATTGLGNRRPQDAPRSIVVSASLAFDYIMTFPGSFKDHILPDKVHVLSVSFLFDSMRRHRGGVAGNIAYNLALLGEPPTVLGAGGTDFHSYRSEFERLGIDMSLVDDVSDELTGSAFMTTDLDNNQIAGFYPGASVHASEISATEVAASARAGVVGATTPDAMRRHVTEMASVGCPLLYDPSQQVVALTAEDLAAGIEAAWAVAGSDYELAILSQKTGIGLDELARRLPLVITTYGEQGSELRSGGEVTRIPAVPAEPLVDPTGGGDAYRAGLLKGLLCGLDLATSGRLAALAATYAVERRGTQEHSYSPEEFVARFNRTFAGESAEIDADVVRYPAPRRTARVGCSL